jgi:hypothetical protein
VLLSCRAISRRRRWYGGARVRAVARSVCTIITVPALALVDVMTVPALVELMPFEIAVLVFEFAFVVGAWTADDVSPDASPEGI